MLCRKPIFIEYKGNETKHYKYIRTGYILGVGIKFLTDLTEKEWENFLDGKYTMEKINRFELTGTFNLM